MLHCSPIFPIAPNKREATTLLARAFIKRLHTHPELMPTTLPKIMQKNMQYLINNPPEHYSLQYDSEIDELAEAEVYFVYKEAMAKKGIQVYDFKHETHWSSPQLRFKRACLFIDYLKEHPALLPDNISPENLNQTSIIEEYTVFFHLYWGLLYIENLEGRTVVSPDQIFPGEDISWKEMLKIMLEPFMRNVSQGLPQN